MNEKNIVEWFRIDYLDRVYQERGIVSEYEREYAKVHSRAMTKSLLEFCNSQEDDA